VLSDHSGHREGATRLRCEFATICLSETLWYFLHGDGPGAALTWRGPPSAIPNLISAAMSFNNVRTRSFGYCVSWAGPKPPSPAPPKAVLVPPSRFPETGTASRSKSRYEILKSYLHIPGRSIREGGLWWSIIGDEPGPRTTPLVMRPFKIVIATIRAPTSVQVALVLRAVLLPCLRRAFANFALAEAKKPGRYSESKPPP